MKSEEDIKEIQRLYKEGTPVRELARCYHVDVNTIRSQCGDVIGEPIKRLERAEILHLLYVNRYPDGQFTNIESLWMAVGEETGTYPRLSKMTRMRFGQVITNCLNDLGWERTGTNTRAYTFSKPKENKTVMLEW